MGEKTGDVEKTNDVNDVVAGRKIIWLTKELDAAGKTRHQIQGAVDTGKLFRVSQGIYTLENPDDLLKLQALSHAHPDATFTGRGATFVYELGHRSTVEWPTPVRMPRGKTRDGGVLLQVTPSQITHAWTVNGVRVTSPIETAVHVEDRDPDDPFLGSEGQRRRRLGEFLQQAYAGAKGNDVLAEDLAALPPRHRRSALRLLDGVITGTASKLELKAITLILNALGDTDVTVLVNHKVRGYRFDIVFKEAKVLVEIDSYAFHAAGGEEAGEEIFISDRWKGNAAARWGWTLLRYTDRCVQYVPRHMADQVVDTVRLRLRWKRWLKKPFQLLESDDLVWWWHPWLSRR